MGKQISQQVHLLQTNQVSNQINIFIFNNFERKIRKFNEKYYLFYIAGTEWILDNGKPEPIYKIRMAESNDGINFIKLNHQLIEDKLGIHEAQASPDVFFKNGKFKFYYRL